jgi:hemerythrin superfamily protein
MDVLEIIKAENQRIKDLFSQLKSESGKQARKLLFDNIRHDIDLHFYAEENVFYPAFKNYEDYQLILKDLKADIIDIKSLVKNLISTDYTSIDFENRAVELMNHFDDHVAREEGEFFPLVRKIMKRQERERLGRHFTTVEQEREQAA